MSFRDQAFGQRVHRLGDQAEAVFEMTYPRGWARYGLNRPGISLKDVPPFIRYTPDYLTSHGAVEVQGFGRDKTAKFKVGKLESLEEWNAHFPVTFFLYDSSAEEFGYLSLADVMSACRDSGTLLTFPEGAPYWAVPKGELGVPEWAALTLPS